MSTTAWQEILDDTRTRIAGISPTVCSEQRWRHISTPRSDAQGGRDREFSDRIWRPEGGVQVFGGGEHQLARVISLQVWYIPSPNHEDILHGDSRDLIAALVPGSTYPSGAWGALQVRRLMDDGIDPGVEVGGYIRATFPLLLIWREPITLI